MCAASFQLPQLHQTEYIYMIVQNGVLLMDDDVKDIVFH